MNFWKFQLKWKIVKHFARQKERAAWRKLFSFNPPPSQAPPIFLVINIEIDICFQIASRMQLLGVKKWCSANIFSDPRQKDVCWKFVKSERFLPVLREHIAFNVKSVEGCKMTFCWFGNFLLGNLKLKNLQLCPSERLDRYKNVACPKLTFSKN